jgi:hypothetical protein
MHGYWHCSRPLVHDSPATRLERLLRCALVAIALAVFTHAEADPDLWGHLRFGQDVIESGTIHIPERYSFASDRLWINHEWLAETVMFLAYRAAGTVGLIALKCMVLLGMMGGVLVALRTLGVSGRRLEMLLAIVLIGTVPQANHLRPQLFSLVLFAWLLATLLTADRRPWWRAAAVAVIMMLWANMHGGWIVGAGTLLLWAGVATVTRAPRPYLLSAYVCAALGALVTAINPYGVRLWWFLRETVGFGRAEIADWQPVYRIEPSYQLLWLGTALLCALALRRRRTRAVDDYPLLALTVALGAATFMVNRLQGFFVLSAVVYAANSTLFETSRSRTAEPHRTQPSRRAVAVAAIVAALLIVGASGVALSNTNCIGMDVSRYPEQELVSVVKTHGLKGRMLTWFDWGEYALWHFAPDIRVSMDGRRETVYSDAAVQAHLRFYAQPEARAELLARLHPDLIWLPTGLPVTSKLQEDGWRPIFTGARSTLLASTGNDTPVVVARSGPARRCFPGP